MTRVKAPGSPLVPLQPDSLAAPPPPTKAAATLPPRAPDAVEARQAPLATGGSPSPVSGALVHRASESRWDKAVAGMLMGDRAAIRSAVVAICKTARDPNDAAIVTGLNDRVAIAFA
jgi:hypothetical protein